MADISLQSERFIALYEEALPRLMRFRAPRAITFDMPAFHSREVIEVLGGVKDLARQGIELAGERASHVVLSGRELSMLQWALQQG